MSLENLFKSQPGEKIVVALRRHPITFIRPVLLFILAAVVPVVAAWLYFNGNFVIENPLLQTLAVLLVGAYYIAIWLLLFSQFVSFYLDIDIVTDKRIVEAVQDSLFSRSVSELDLSRVQDVTSEVHGFFATMFNYGKVTVQTAGEHEHFLFHDVHRPHEVREKILELSHSDRKSEAKELMGEVLRKDEV